METRKKPVKMLLVVIFLLILPLSNSHATMVTLDGIANAGYWADDLSNSYLYVKDLTDSSYYYQWRYDDTDALRWDNMDDLVADLNAQGISWWLESGGNPFNNTPDPIWTSIYLEKGYYEISLASDSSAYNLEAYWENDNWNAYVQMWTDYGDDFNFGEGAYTSNSEQDALQFYHANVDGMTFSLTDDTNLYFYINDNNSIDNSGSIQLSVAVVPEPGTFLLLGLGVVGLVGYRKKLKK